VRQGFAERVVLVVCENATVLAEIAEERWDAEEKQKGCRNCVRETLFLQLVHFSAKLRSSAISAISARTVNASQQAKPRVQRY
jgi:hypothetical protein